MEVAQAAVCRTVGDNVRRQSFLARGRLKPRSSLSVGGERFGSPEPCPPVRTRLVWLRRQSYAATMKTLTVREAEGQLARLISAANEGEIIVLKDGDKEATLYSARALEPEEDSPELEAELLKAVDGPHFPLRESELREVADQVIREHQARRKP